MKTASAAMMPADTAPGEEPVKPTTTTKNTHNNNNSNPLTSPKMGSRRIFTPQFKLQVLESYRNDSDCKGNQRATARKYNIHRRQIQKWLQCESNLRSSVTSLGQSNGLKHHQFHNISRHQVQQPAAATAPQSATASATPSHQHQLPPQYGYSEGHAAAMRGAGNSHEMFAAANLAAVVAAAMSSAAATTANSAPHTPLRPTALNGGVGPGMLPPPPPPPHHQHYTMVYSPAVGMPLLTHHLSPPTHMHQYHQFHHQQQQQHLHHSLPHVAMPATRAFMPPSAALSLPTAAASTPSKPHLNGEWMAGSSGTRTDSGEVQHLEQGASELFKAPQPAMLPIDLSLGVRRDQVEIKEPATPSTEATETAEVDSRPAEEARQNAPRSDVVDLTYRKRKCFALRSDHGEEAMREKHSKVSGEAREDDIVDVEGGGELVVDVVEGEEAKCSATPPLKPVKLFKPYLLDGNSDGGGAAAEASPECLGEQKAPIIWSNHPECLSPRSFDSRQCSSRESYFQSPSIEKCPFPFGSPPLHKQPASGGGGDEILPTTDTPTTSKVPASFCCPKGSPVSGYESSSSTYSENSFRGGEPGDHPARSYRFDLKMQRVYTAADTDGDSADACPIDSRQQTSQIQRWLNHDTTTSPESSASIVLYA